MFKAIFLGALMSGIFSLVIGSQGTSAGYAAIHQIALADYRMFWSWPIFFAASGVWWGLDLIQR